LAVPRPLQVVALPYWQAGPAKPALQTQAPLLWAWPRPEQVMASLNWHEEPAYPEAHWQLPEAEQVPCPWQVVDAEQAVQLG
jgi:hypothetical protein